MPPRVRQATTDDAAQLVRLMSEFYGEAGYRLDPARASAVFGALLADPGLGSVWLLEAGGDVAGYVVLTLGYSLEYGGRDAFVDDLFVRAPFRGRGVGRLALAAVREACERLGVRALHLEVERDNAPAQALYRKAGFVDTDRLLLTLKLTDSSHSG